MDILSIDTPPLSIVSMAFVRRMNVCMALVGIARGVMALRIAALITASMAASQPWQRKEAQS